MAKIKSAAEAFSKDKSHDKSHDQKKDHGKDEEDGGKDR